MVDVYIKQTLLNTLLLRARFVKFVLTGGSGAALNIVITFFLTHFVFGAERYFTAFLIGTAFNVVYNFTLYTISVFETHTYHVRRFVAFVVYSILMTALQLYLVQVITEAVGVSFYLLIIAAVIGTGAFFNYAIFKASIFKTSSYAR